MNASKFELTDYGFRWNAAEVSRYISLPDGSVVVGIAGAGNQEVEVYVSPHGRSVRVFRKGHGELFPSPSHTL